MWIELQENVRTLTIDERTPVYGLVLEAIQVGKHLWHLSWQCRVAFTARENIICVIDFVEMGANPNENGNGGDSFGSAIFGTHENILLGQWRNLS